MLIGLTVKQVPHPIEAWFQTPHGCRVMDHIRTQLKPLAPMIKGDKILQLGTTCSSPLCHQLSFEHQWVISPGDSGQKHAICGAYEQLPFETESLNTLLVPLSFSDINFNDWPLDELDRVLKSMGYVIFVAINPLSLWGLSMHMQQTSFIHQRVSQLPSLLTLKRALLRRGFQHFYVNYFYYLPPVTRTLHLNRFRFIEQMGELFPPWPAAFYLLVMKKTNIIPPDLDVAAFQAKSTPSLSVCD